MPLCNGAPLSDSKRSRVCVCVCYAGGKCHVGKGAAARGGDKTTSRTRAAAANEYRQLSGARMKERRLGEELWAEIKALRGLDSEAFEQVAAIAAAQLRSGAPGRQGRQERGRGARGRARGARGGARGAVVCHRRGRAAAAPGAGPARCAAGAAPAIGRGRRAPRAGGRRGDAARAQRRERPRPPAARLPQPGLAPRRAGTRPSAHATPVPVRLPAGGLPGAPAPPIPSQLPPRSRAPARWAAGACEGRRRRK